MRSPWQDAHDASRMFLPELLKPLKLRGSPVAMVPNWDFLLVTGNDDHDNLKAMAELVDEMLQQDRPMTGVAFRFDGRHWTPFLPTANYVSHQPLRQTMMRSRAMEYAEQKKLMDAIHEKTGEDERRTAPPYRDISPVSA